MITKNHKYVFISVSPIIVVSLLVVVTVILILIVLNINKNFAVENLSQASDIIDVTKNVSSESYNFVCTGVTGKKVIIKNMSSIFSPVIIGYILNSTKDLSPYNQKIDIDPPITLEKNTIAPIELTCIPKTTGYKKFQLSLITDNEEIINIYVTPNSSADICEN